MSESKFSQFKSCIFGLMALVNVLVLRFEEAEKLLDAAIACSRSVAYNYGLRAYVRIQLGKFEGAVADATTKLELKPEEAATYALRGWAHYCMQEPQKAIEDISHSLELDPARKTDYQDTLRLIDCYQILGRDQEAIELCDEILSVSSFDYFLMEIRVRKAASLMNLVRYEESLGELDLAFGLAGSADRAEIHKMKADLYELKGEAELAKTEKESHNRIKLHQAELTEWMPATGFRRLMANFLDGSLVGLSAAFLFLYAFVLFPACFGGGMTHISDMILLAVPYTLCFFLIGFFDSNFPFLSPLLIGTVLYRLCFSSAPEMNVSQTEVAIATVLILMGLLNLVYHTYFLAGPGQATPGKKYLGIKVTGRTGQSLTANRALLRHALRALIPLSYFLIIGFYLYQVSFHLDLFFLICITLLSLLFYLFFCRPGLHNLFASALVSDVRLHGGLGAQFGLYRRTGPAD